MIPKVVHYLWMSEEKTPEAEICLASWKDKLKGYEIKEWNKTNFPYQDFIWTREAFEKKKWAFVTDFFRLWVLYHYGGIYMDADVTVTGTFDKFLDHPLFIGCTLNRLCSFLIGAEKGHPYIGRCLKYYDNRHFVKEDGSLDQKIIPCIMTKIFMSQYNYDGKLINFEGKPFIIKDMAIYPSPYFTINTYDGNNVCYHHGVGSWKDKDMKYIVRENVIGKYLLAKHFSYSVYHQYKGLKKLLFLLMPGFVLSLIYSHKLKIKSNKGVKSVDLS